MCLICYEGLSGAALLIATLFPRLRPRLESWFRHRMKPHLRGQVVTR